MTYQEIKDRLSKCELTLEKIKNGNTNSTEAKNQTAKLELLRESYVKLLKEAEKTASRKLEDASSKAELIVDKAEQKNEAIKQKKIQEARSKFNKLKSEYETYKGEQKVEMKEREVLVVGKEKDLQIKMDQFSTKEEAIENREVEVKTIKENLEKQLKIIARKKEELENANEKQSTKNKVKYFFIISNFI